MRKGALAVAAAAGLLSACSTVNDGVGDIKYWSQGWDAVAPAAGQLVTKETPFSISVQKGFIANFQELPVSKHGLMARRMPFVEHGEIAILVNATLAGETPGALPTDAAAAFNDYRLIYYSDDVYPGQFFSFDNAMVYGPGKISSGTVRLEFVILELDRTSAQSEQLIRRIAELSKSPLAASGPAAAAMLSLGTTLVTSTNDDRQMRFEVTFSLDGGANPLRFGRYVLRRAEDRSMALDWSGVCVNDADGRLYVQQQPVGAGRARPACGTGPEFRQDTYLSFTVNPRATDSAEFKLRTFGDLATSIRGSTNPTVASIEKSVAAMVTAEAEEASKDAAIQGWMELEAKTRSLAQSKVKVVAGDCAVLDDQDPQVRQAEMEVRLQAASFHARLVKGRDYVARMKEQPERKDQPLSDAWSEANFEKVARSALTFVAPQAGGAGALDVSKTLAISNVGADGLFKDQETLVKALTARAALDAAAAKTAGQCRAT